MKYVGLVALTTIISHIVFIYIAFWAVQGLRLDRYVPEERQRFVRVVIVLVAVALGYATSSFFLNIIDNIRNLGYLI